MQPSRLRSLLGSLVEPFTSRRHAAYMARLAEIDRVLKATREDVLQLRSELAGPQGGLAGEDAAPAPANLGSFALRLKQLEEKVAGESRNLGMIAGGLEHLRSSVQDVDITRDKFLAYEQALEDIARRVDELGRVFAPGGERRASRS